MKLNLIIFFLTIAVVLGVFFIEKHFALEKAGLPAQNTASSLSYQKTQNPPLSQSQETVANQNSSSNTNSSDFQPPLDRAADRVTKKPFGIFITPQTSPVQPEKFRGFHTGTDFEIFPNEIDSDVAVHAVCSGTIAEKKYASGYGGVMVQNCQQNNQPVTVIYGHLKLASIVKKAGDNLKQGETIGILGKGYSSETNGERKHLHLGIHKGKSINILGYVQTKVELSGWIDPCTLVCR